jgi:hypothetical protein
MKPLNSTFNGIKETSYPVNTWQDIENMPIYNWIKILETGDLKYLFKNEKGRVTKALGRLWLDLQQQYINEFGLDQNFKQQIRLKRELLELNADFIITRDNFLLNLIRIKETDIRELNGKKAFQFYEVLDHVEKYKGFQIDPKQTSVKKWYWTLKNMAKHGGSN